MYAPQKIAYAVDRYTNEAKRLYGCRGLSGTISRLRLEHDIVTIRQVDENGNSCASYKLNLPAAPDPDEPPLFDLTDDPASEPDVQSDRGESPEASPEGPAVEAVDEPVPSTAARAMNAGPSGIDALTVRWTSRGPEIQVVPAGGDGSEPFHLITRPQARYLFENMKVILESE